MRALPHRGIESMQWLNCTTPANYSASQSRLEKKRLLCGLPGENGASALNGTPHGARPRRLQDFAALQTGSGGHHIKVRLN